MLIMECARALASRRGAGAADPYALAAEGARIERELYALVGREVSAAIDVADHFLSRTTTAPQPQ